MGACIVSQSNSVEWENNTVVVFALCLITLGMTLSSPNCEPLIRRDENSPSKGREEMFVD